MFINATGFYVPEERVDNQHFLELNGLTSEWIEQRTGIRSRSKAKAEENINTMSMFIGHQANMRIMSNIAKQLNLPEEKFLHNIEELGNTGSVSSALVYAQNDHSFKKGDLVAITVFGGGYSTGACLIKC